MTFQNDENVPKKTFFTLIVPVYNSKDFLPHCIDSILSQTETDFELLLVDDGSLDGSGKMCDIYSLKDNRIKVFHKKNEGPGAARNLALDNANGQWIFFIDSDDWIELDLLKKLREVIDSNIKAEQFDIIHFNGYVENVGAQKSRLMFPQINFTEIVESNEFLSSLCEPYKMDLWNKVFRYKVIQDIRFSKSLKIGEDLVYNFDAIRASKNILIFPFSGYHYRINPHSLCSEIYNSDNKFDLPNAVQYICQKVDSSPLLYNYYFSYWLKVSVALLFRIFLHKTFNNYNAIVSTISFLKKNYSLIKKDLKLTNNNFRREIINSFFLDFDDIPSKITNIYDEMLSHLSSFVSGFEFVYIYMVQDILQLK